MNFRTKHLKAEMDFYAKHLNQLVHGKIVAAGSELIDAEVWPFIDVQVGDQEYRVRFSRDEEGNGPGFPEIER